MAIKRKKYSDGELQSMTIQQLETLNEELDVDYNDGSWIGNNEHGNSYYYPVIPKFNRKGEFDESFLGLQTNEDGSERIPFGSIPWNKEVWAPVDLLAPVTKEDYESAHLKVTIVSDQVESNIQDDASGNQNFGFVISDYKPKFEIETSVPVERKNTERIKVNKKTGAF